MSIHPNQILQGDCVEELAGIKKGSIDLVFADPPFNIGYDYDVYRDDRESSDYLDWSEKWIQGVYRALEPSGTFWLAIGDEYAAELKIIAQRTGFVSRSWIIWYYTFGVNCRFTCTFETHAVTRIFREFFFNGGCQELVTDCSGINTCNRGYTSIKIMPSKKPMM